MFKFLKKKISESVGKISKDVEEKGAEEVVEVEVEEKKEKKGFFQRRKEKKERKKETEDSKIEIKEEKEEVIKVKEPEVKKEKKEPKKVVEKAPKKEPKKAPKVEEKKEVVKEEPKKVEEPKEEKKGFFSKIKQKMVTKTINESQFEDMFWELEVALLENNVAVEVIEKIKVDLKKNLVEVPLKKNEIEKIITKSLRESIEEVLSEGEDMLEKIKSSEKKPYIIVFLGSNGAGKTTTIAKVAKLLQDNGMKSVMAAADTFRSAAIQQLEEHSNKLNIPVIKHNYGSDPAAVAFDAVKMAKAKFLDVVLIDTAGRQHSNANLLDEMKKLIKVVEPDMKVYIGEMIAGNDCIEQVQSFNDAISIDGVILTKSEIDEKGGTAISTTYVTKKPIYFLGIGQEYKDIEKFDKEKILGKLGL